MDLNSTQFIRYQEINADNTDLYADAWGFESVFPDVLSVLDNLDPSPDNNLVNRLIEIICKES